MANKKTMLRTWSKVEFYLDRGSDSISNYSKREEIKQMQEPNYARLRAALELLRFKAARQMCEGKTTCTLNETDIQEVLFVAGIVLDQEVEVIK